MRKPRGRRGKHPIINKHNHILKGQSARCEPFFLHAGIEIPYSVFKEITGQKRKTMPSGGLLALLDDIATMSKVAATKTAGISGDDLAVNSKALVGIDPKRELPIVYEVAKGSLRNKAILIPGALALSFAAPWAIMPLLTLGGAYLCFEGIEKILHKEHGAEEKNDQPVDMKALEKQKIGSAIKTDLVLSAEIVAVTLGAVAASPIITQVAVLTAVGIGMTVGIYGLVGGIVKLDDVGLWLSRKKGDGPVAKAQRGIGRALVAGVPHMMKAISVVGTAAMFMVGGGLVLHGIPAAHGLLEAAGHLVANIPFIQTAVEMTAATLAGAVTGLAAVPVMKAVGNIGEKTAPFFARVKAAAAKAKAAVFKKKPSAVAKTASPKPEPQTASTTKAPSALSSAPDMKAAHDTAALRQDNAAKNTATAEQGKKPPAKNTAGRQP
jgi:predicted DNA repair protein MutK